MRVWKTWVWPILKGLVVAVVAVALIKIAFFPDRADDTAALPTGAIAEPTVHPERGSIVNTLTVKGAVARDRAQDGKVPMSGVVQEVFVQQGATVNYGQTIASIKQTTEKPPVQNPDGTTTERAPEVTWHEVTAPATGTVTALNVIARQTVNVGEVAVQVTPAQLLVTGTIPAVQQYRLQQQPADAQVTITGGPAPFTCTDLKIGQPAPGTSGSGATGSGGAGQAGAGASTGGSGGDASHAGGEGGSTTVSCRIPAEVQAFAGVEATMTIEGGRIDDVLTLPVTAVKGQSGTGVVTVLEANGTRTERTVTLGLTDGTRVEIKDGVTEADAVLQFVPSKPRPTAGGDCELDPATGSCASFGGDPADGGMSDGAGEGSDGAQP